MQRQKDGSWRTNGCHLVQPSRIDSAHPAQWMRPPALVAPSTVWRGRPYPLGATWDGAGVNFALFSKHAERVELCLFDPKGRREIERVELRERSDFVWHCYLPEARPGQLYAYRVHGPHDPTRGHRFDPDKLAARPVRAPDPAARRPGAARWSTPRSPGATTGRRARRGATRCSTSCTSKGFTQLHPDVPEQLRGTYAGLATPAGDRAPEAPRRDRGRAAAGPRHGGRAAPAAARPAQLLGLQQHRLLRARAALFGHAARVGEFKTMVKTLHAAGLEVILDVVYNHTARRRPHRADARASAASTTRSTTASIRAHPRALSQLHRHRQQPQHRAPRGARAGDGQPALLGGGDARRRLPLRPRRDARARRARRFDRNGAFLAAVRQDPVLSQVKLIAEPWDLGEGGYQLGNFPPGWSEWNDKYRDAVRSYWKGDDGMIGELASRISGSSDLFESERPRARPRASTSSPRTTASRCTTW